MADPERTIKRQLDPTIVAGAKQAVIIVLKGASVGLALKLESDRSVIGRGQTAQLVLSDPAASREHSEVVRRILPDGVEEYSLRDLSSTNGSFINGTPVDGERRLKDGDKIKIGDHLLRFCLMDDLELEVMLKTMRDTGQIPAAQVVEAVRFSPFKIPRDVDLLYRDESVVPLEPRAVKVLRYLAEHNERVVKKDELLEAVWPDVFTTDGVLKKAISQARRALCDDPKESRFIETYHGRGYRFIAPVERISKKR